MLESPRTRLVLIAALALPACMSSGTPAPGDVPKETPQAKEEPTPIRETDSQRAIEQPPEEDPPELPTIAGPNLEQLNPDIAGVGTEAFEAAFPEQAGGLARTSMHSNAAGTAGRWGDGANATYGEGEQAVDVNVTDMIHALECKPGEWAAYVDEIAGGKKTDPPTEVVALGKRSALYTVEKSAELGTVRSLGLRLGDRCALGLSGDAVNKAGLIAVAKDLGLDELEAACAKRDERRFGLGR